MHLETIYSQIDMPNLQYFNNRFMRFTHRIKKQEVLEWGDCYIGYKKLKVLLKVLQFRVENVVKNQPCPLSLGSTQELVYQNADQNMAVLESGTSFQNKQFLQKLKGLEPTAKQNCDKANKILISTLKKQVDLFGKFSRNKYEEIQCRYNKCLRLYRDYQTGQKNQRFVHDVLIPYVQCIYVQANDLSMMYESNTQAERRILDKHQLYSQNLYPTPLPRVSSEISIGCINKLLREIQKLYVELGGDDQQSSRIRIHKLAEMHQKDPSSSMLVGMMVGFFVAVCIFLGLILGYKNEKVQTGSIFNTDFPIWRGIALFIAYAWVIGVNMHHYEKYNISHRAILENTQTKYPTSTGMYIFAGFFTALLIVVFTLYVLDISDTIELAINPQILPVFVWIPFLVYFFNPISIFYFRSRDYVLKLLFKILISFAIPITFPIAYGTDQFTSLFLPFRGIVYAICYYSRGEFTAQNEQKHQNTGCEDPADIFILVFSIVVFCYRVMQCIKLGFQVKPYNHLHWINGFKYFLAMVATILSYMLKYNRGGILPAWIVFAAITSVFTYYWDLKYDWFLLHKDSERILLRDKIIYPKKFYYILIVFNLFLRCSWVLTISPSISNDFLGGSPQLFILLFALIQMVRRGVWNMLFVEAEQYKNTKVLNALPQSFFEKQKKINKVLAKNKEKQKNGVSQDVLNQIVSNISNEEWQKITKQKQEILALVEAKRQKIKEMKKYIKQSNCKDEELIDYLNQDSN